MYKRQGERFAIQPQLHSQIDKELARLVGAQVTPLRLVLEQGVVVLPELLLRAGRFGRFGRLLGVSVDARQRKVTVDYLDIIRVSVCQTL